MQCDRAGELIGAYLDQELDAETRREVAAHLGGCPACSALADEFARVSRQLAAIGREPAPEHLVAGVRCARWRRDRQTASAAPGRSNAGGAGAGCARPLPCCSCAAVTAAATALVMSRMTGMAMLEREVAAAHVRSLLQESPMQIASSEAHTVKPWFAGRLDFAPGVKDLAAEGFPLAGARLDYIGERALPRWSIAAGCTS